MGLAKTYRRTLRQRALDQYGFITTRDAEELGVPAAELPNLKRRGGIERVSHGVYRFEDIPRTAKDQFMEAVLCVGPDAYLVGDAVLALHDLAQVNPRRIRVATPHRRRRELPDFIEVLSGSVDSAERTQYEGVPATTVARALRDCQGIVMPDRLVDAANEAARVGLLCRREAVALLRALRRSAAEEAWRGQEDSSV